MPRLRPTIDSRHATGGHAGLLMLVMVALGLGACGETRVAGRTGAGPVLSPGEAAPDGAGSGRYKVGAPYEINGKWYHPRVDYDYDETGIASWYGPKFHGRKTANGETFDQHRLTAAHKTLPLPSMVRVTNLENGRQVKLRVNDRGPFSRGRIIDVSTRAAELLDFRQQGTAKVRVQVIESESRRLAALARGGPSQAGAVDVPEAAPTVTVAVNAADREDTGANGQDGAVRRVAAVPEPDGRVTRVAVGDSDIFIQAGSFVRYDNARRLSARLSALAPTRIEPVRLNQRRFYRVRLGPVDTVADADRLLGRVLRQGHGEAQVVVD